MKANPGGQLPPSQIVGRDELIRRLWRVLERQSLVLSAERRIGKTCLMRKMIAEAGQTDGRLMVYRDLEGVRTRLELVELLLQDVENHLSRSQRTARRARELLAQLGGTELTGLIKLPSVAAVHWKSLLASTIGDLTESRERPVILFWDEFSLLLHNLYRQEGVSAATELLDVLRSLRQMHSALRMVFTGSVGLLNIIGNFRQQGYANDPLNDMYKVIVPALESHHAKELARQLLTGERIRADDLDRVAGAIATAVDNLPYYIHHVVDHLAFRGETVSEADIDQIVANGLSDPADPWDMRHYQDRISSYYSEIHQSPALGLLDAIAATDEALDSESLFKSLAATEVTEDREIVRRALMMLQSDHYLVQGSDGRYRFVFPLIRRWWSLHRS